MGLMYVFPVKEDERDERVLRSDKSLILKTYGLPMIFWGYLSAIFVIVFVMTLAIKEPIRKILLTEDPINILLGWTVIFTLIGVPVMLLCFFFYEKWIIKQDQSLTVLHKVFWLPILKRQFKLKNHNSFEIKHYLDSPNVARIQKKQELRGFENQGYYELYLIDQNDNKIFIDRNSRKADLKKMSSLLSQF